MCTCKINSAVLCKMRVRNSVNVSLNTMKSFILDRRSLLQGEEWSQLRKALAPKMLRPKDIWENLENFNNVTRDTIDHMLAIRGSHGSEGEIPDLEQELAKWATESVGTMAFDLRVGLYDDPPNKDTIKMIQATNNAFLYLSKLSRGLEGMLFKFITTPSFWKFCQEQDTAIEIAHTFLEKKKKIELQQMADEGKEFAANEAVPLLTYLLSKAELTPEEISMNCISMFRAGIETTAAGALWLLYELARNPRVQERLYEEVTSLVGPHGDFTPKSFAKLDYIKACVKETMRLHPVASSWARVLTEDVVLAGYQVPAKTTVVYSNSLAGRSDKLFQDPFEFKPERWMKGESQVEIHPFAIIPFGLGPRMCLGRRIAETEMYLLTAKVIQRFVLEYHHEPVEMTTTLVGVPDRPVKIKFVDRE